MNDWARAEGYAGLGYVTRKGGEFGGPIAKNHGTEGMEKLYAELGLGADDLFFAAGKAGDAAKLAGAARTRVGKFWASSTRAASNSPGSSISRSTRKARSRAASTLPTTPSPCRRAGWRR
jgi:aspartyl-tRNA synthetase